MTHKHNYHVNKDHCTHEKDSTWQWEGIYGDYTYRACKVCYLKQAYAVEMLVNLKDKLEAISSDRKRLEMIFSVERPKGT